MTLLLSGNKLRLTIFHGVHNIDKYNHAIFAKYSLEFLYQFSEGFVKYLHPMLEKMKHLRHLCLRGVCSDHTLMIVGQSCSR